jgi:hypothetical protein
MFVLARSGPTKGRPLRFEIDLALAESSTLIRVEGKGQVIRVERPAPKSRRTGFAVANLWFKLRGPRKGSTGRTVVNARAADGIRERALPKRLVIARTSDKPFHD